MDLHISLFSAFIISLFLSRLLIPKIQQICFKKELFDAQDSRKVHSGIIPRLGGAAFFPVLLFTFLFILNVNIILQTPLSSYITVASSTEWTLALSGILILSAIGIEDDLINVRYRKKFILQIIAAMLFTFSGVWINDLQGLFGIYEIPAVIGIPFTVFIIVFIINSINLIDGIDGLASGIGMIAFIYYGFLFLHMGLYIYSILAFISLGMLVPFFYYNVFGNVNKGRKIFMGDSGSLTLGMLLSVFAVKVCHIGQVDTLRAPHIIIAFSILIVPMFDTLRVAVLRIYTRRNPFKPDKNHIHHIFLRLGFSHKAAMAIILLIVIFFGAVNIFFSSYLSTHILLVINVLMLSGMYIYLTIKVKRIPKSVGLKDLKIYKIYEY
jgi:UDP-N-acetylmuramyl pentapeptide phosphotransferase/UDP-N-acetylglucosamine-1-phosphate transferase